MGPEPAALVAQIYSAAWMVRHYARGRSSAIHRLERQQAIQQLGLIVREALNCSDDFEAILRAVVDGLKADDEPPF